MTYETLLYKLLESNEALTILTAENRAAIRNLPNIMPERFIDFGIAEMTMLGAAAGLAKRGRISVTHALATFLTLRAYEFARTDIGIPGLPVKLVGGVAGFLSEANGPTHQAVEDIGVMRSIPAMRIFCPADNDEMISGLPQVLESAHPYYIRFNNKTPVYFHEQPFEEGVAEVIGVGTDIAILSYGYVSSLAYQAMLLLDSAGIGVRFINLRTVKPIDTDAILDAARHCSLLVTIEDHFLTGGLYSIVSEFLIKERLAPRVLPIALNNRWFKPALLETLLPYEGFTPQQLRDTMLAALQSLERTSTLHPVLES